MLSIRTGGLLVKGPAESEVYEMDWGSEHLAPVVTIAASFWTLTLLNGEASDPMMTFDYTSIVEGGRHTQLRCVGGVNGQLYDVSNTITTTETPPRIKDRSFFLSIEDR